MGKTKKSPYHCFMSWKQRGNNLGTDDVVFNNGKKYYSYSLRPRLYLAKNYTEEKAGNDKNIMKQS